MKKRRKKTLFGWLLKLMLISFLPMIVLTQGIVYFSAAVVGIEDNLSYLCIAGLRDLRLKCDMDALSADLRAGRVSAETEKMQVLLRQYAIEEGPALKGTLSDDQIIAAFILVSDGGTGFVYGGGYWQDGEKPGDMYAPAELPGNLAEKLNAYAEDGCLLLDRESGEHFLSMTSLICAPMFEQPNPLKAYYCIIPGRVSYRLLNVESARKFSYIEVTLLLVMLAVMLLALFFLVRGKVLKPLAALEVSARQFEQNCRENPDPGKWVFKKPKKHLQNEIGSLVDSISQMAGQMQADMTALLSEIREREKRKAELDMAAAIQKGSLPSVFPPFPERKDFAVYASMMPAREVGGDFYDFGLLDGDHLWFAVGDVSDKGMPAAMFMMMAKTALHNLSAGCFSPAEILSNANRALFENNPKGMFVTIWIGILDLRDGLLTCTNGGHTTPVICRADGRIEVLPDKHDFLVGCRPNRTYHEYVHRLEKGDAVFVFSDGVTEARTENGDLFGPERMEAALKEAADLSPEGLIRAVQSRVDLFTGEAETADDITMIAVRWTGADGTDGADGAGGADGADDAGGVEGVGGAYGSDGAA